MGNYTEQQIELKAPISRVWRALTDYREFGGRFAASSIARSRLGMMADGPNK